MRYRSPLPRSRPILKFVRCLQVRSRDGKVDRLMSVAYQPKSTIVVCSITIAAFVFGGILAFAPNVVYHGFCCARVALSAHRQAVRF
jgi:hypothetical protein